MERNDVVKGVTQKRGDGILWKRTEVNKTKEVKEGRKEGNEECDSDNPTKND
uniref:Uncharacterized protein n=1 Tax=Cucumis melo TaxID=3656 RepID=A0A9I9CR12_CUCME